MLTIHIFYTIHTLHTMHSMHTMHTMHCIPSIPCIMHSMCTCTRSFVHSLILSLTHSFIHSIHPFIRPFSFFHSFLPFIRPFIRPSLIRPFIHPFIRPYHSSIHLLSIHSTLSSISFVHSLIHSLLCQFIHFIWREPFCCFVGIRICGKYDIVHVRLQLSKIFRALFHASRIPPSTWIERVSQKLTFCLF